MNGILKVQNLRKIYRSGNSELTVLDDISFSLNEGDTFSIVGPSGSGKTTLLGLCAGLDDPSSGSIHLNDRTLNGLSQDERAKLRMLYVGFIFQNFQLIPTLTALENVMVPMELKGETKIKDQALELLTKVGLKERAGHYPTQLSGGEQQRVAVARAFANKPRILFADEPTGNLDAENSDKIIRLLFDLNKAAGTTLVLVTHDSELAAMTGRQIRLKGGKVIHDSLMEA